MLTVMQMMEYTRVYKPSVLKSAKSVTVKFKKPVSMVDEDGDKYTLVNALCRGDTIQREVELRFYGPRNKNSQCWVSCSCEFFLYHTEYALTKKGSSDIIHCNGARPKVTNKRTIAAVCKHIASCFLNGAQTLKPAAK